VHVHYEGDANFLTHPSIASAKNYAGLAEIILSDPKAAQSLLAHAIANGTAITRFEVMEPTLEEIFIETVGENVDA
jgi:ABC-2 type transport system ATP-binding protein